MKEHPILFSGPMVRAILEGRKTQTRRVMKYQPKPFMTEVMVEHIDEGPAVATYRAYPGKGTARWAITACPFGRESDRLWVREAFDFRILDAKTRSVFLRYKTDPDVLIEIVLTKREWNRVRRWKKPAKGKWRGMPGMFMVRSMSRLTLEITGISVQRIQGISDRAAEAEGVSGVDHGHGNDYGGRANHLTPFHKLWDSLNAKRGFGWKKNPWVWVITFKRIEP
jgi:hypothetical protein